MTEPGEDTVESAAERPLRVLVLVKSRYLSIEALRQYLECLERHSEHRVRFADIDQIETDELDFSGWEAVAVHWSVRVAFAQVGPLVEAALGRFGGLRVLFLQDEYQRTDQARRWIREQRVHLVLSVVPAPHVETVYPPETVGNARFVSLLTGCVGDSLLERAGERLPHVERPLDLVYRGREERAWFGDLYRDKVLIGRKVSEEALRAGLAVDVSCDESDRILGPGWLDFLQSGRACLATESGSNVFDETGELQACVEEALAEQPSLSYEELKERCGIEEHASVRMNQISPRVFEAAALRTALVCMEGDYSGVLRPDEHFIPLHKDFSNLDEVVRRLQDVAGVEAMAERVYEDVVGSGRYSSRRFAARIDDALTTTFRSSGVARGKGDRHRGLDLGSLMSAAIEAERQSTLAMRARDEEIRRDLLRALTASQETLSRLRTQNARLRQQREASQEKLDRLRRSVANKEAALESTRAQNSRLREQARSVTEALAAQRRRRNAS